MPYGDRMRPHTRAILPRLVVFTLGFTVAISGCAATPVPAPSTPAPSPTPAVAPVFASNAEALAAATEAYAAYEEMVTLVAAEGGIYPERVEAVTSGSYEEFLVQDLKAAQSAGLRAIGKATFDGVTLQRVDEKAADGLGVVVVYLCSDVSQVDVVDMNNVSQVDADRIPRTALEVAFDWELGAVGTLTVGSRTVWTGGGVC